MDGVFLKSVAFGIAIAAAIGPIALLIVSHAASRGLLPGCFAGLGAALADLAYAWLAFSAGARDLPTMARHPAGSLLPTFLLTLVNPMTLAMFAGFAPELPLAGSLATAGWLAFGLFCGSLLVQLALAAGGMILGAALAGPGWRRAINLAGAAGIFAFGVAGIFAAS